ncbi:hypothetical protein AHAS_Ahas20G0126200 [Arachis hypogaea]
MNGIKNAVYTNKGIRLLVKNQYTSNVESGSTRTEIKHWVELFFGVKVISTKDRNKSTICFTSSNTWSNSRYSSKSKTCRIHTRKSTCHSLVIRASRKRPGRNMAFKLSSELVDAAKGSGDAICKKEETHRMAEANRAFAHFR